MPNVGADDFRISDAGGTGNAFSRAHGRRSPTTRSTTTTWWSGGATDLDAGTADGELEIYGQRLDGTTAAELGTNDFRISAIGPAGNTDWFAFGPGIAHNPDDDEYLVVWTATESASGRPPSASRSSPNASTLPERRSAPTTSG